MSTDAPPTMQQMMAEAREAIDWRVLRAQWCAGCGVRIDPLRLANRFGTQVCAECEAPEYEAR